MNVVLILIGVVLSYLAGSICSAVLISRAFSLPDPCAEGSKNPGATNVLRLAGKKYAAMVLLADLAKGFLPVFFVKSFGASADLMSLLGFSAVLGHMYPIFFQFKGGKGVATALGVLLAFNWVLGLLTIGTWLVVAKLAKHSSLAALVALTLAPFYSRFLLHYPGGFWVLLGISALVIYRHRANIVRLMQGTEPKISFL